MQFSIKAVAIATTGIAIWIALIQNVPVIGDIPALAFPLCIALAIRPADSQCHRTFVFASVATLAFGLASWTNRWLSADSLVFTTTPTQYLISYFPFFLVSVLVGSVNLISPMRGKILRSPIPARLVGGTLLGLAPIPVNYVFFFVDDYLPYFEILLPSKIAEITTVIVAPIVVCTVTERVILQFSRGSAGTSLVQNSLIQTIG